MIVYELGPFFDGFCWFVCSKLYYSARIFQKYIIYLYYIQMGRCYDYCDICSDYDHIVDMLICELCNKIYCHVCKVNTQNNDKVECMYCWEKGSADEDEDEDEENEEEDSNEEMNKKN